MYDMPSMGIPPGYFPPRHNYLNVKKLAKRIPNRNPAPHSNPYPKLLYVFIHQNGSIKRKIHTYKIYNKQKRKQK